jgi:hypothetical protein
MRRRVISYAALLETPASTAARAGGEAINLLTFQPDHSMGAGHFVLIFKQSLTGFDSYYYARAIP